MRMEFEVHGDSCVVHLKGRFTIGTELEYLRARDELRIRGVREVLIDCRELEYLDSTGLSFVVELYKMLDGRLALADANSRILEVLCLTGLAGIIPVLGDANCAHWIPDSRSAQGEHTVAASA
jgi:stage II sporulation protein AA (anti-sigma F factor antagonist)